MPQSLRYFSMIVITLGLTIGGCVSHSPATKADNGQQRLTDQSVLAVNWMQQSGEYRALSFQAFNAAEMAFDQSVAKHGLKKAVVVDLDETMLDNSAYAGWQIQQHQPFSGPTWSRWTQARQARALPGAVDFSHYVIAHGGRIFYVSNRDERDYQATADNLKALGFADVSAQTLLLKPAGGSSNKAGRFDALQRQGYDITVFVGDNLNDFSGEPYHQLNTQRREFVNHHQGDFGRKYIMLPNPSYGDWESGLAPNYLSASPQEKLRIRAKMVEAWDGK
ncbi:5'-nucleotidase, lipoprotein e(P4) family [Martelella alba]|uniref:5'-nucleotidase, lipoprotein e(P4) family n=1 Tax=Martelella alba TaxID=2590451 RepID=A0ABY2SNC4_9HYPH|nr:5'-nucleotidase, lipoprotein e(P4) family [Martelella alba]TKI07444.1 5'-nucleotidase, lipoprotein e(P4) family [Martelella alba]